MPKHALSRRATGAAAAGALALAAVALTAPAASAAVLTGTAEPSISFATGGGGGCTVSNPGFAPGATPFLSDGGTFAVNQSSSAVATDPGDLTDTSNLSGSINSSARATEAGGVLKTLDVTSHLTAAVTSAQGAATDCNSEAQSLLEVSGTFVVPSPTVLEFEGSTKGTGNGIVQAVLQRTSGGPITAVFEVDAGVTSKYRRVATIPAGTYVVQLIHAATAEEPDLPTDVTSSDVKITTHLTFSAPGTAPDAATGNGKKYLTYPAGLTCATHSLVADFTKKAGKKPKKGKKPVINKATFYVNNAKVKTVKKPNKKTNVTLSGLPDTDEVVVEARLKLSGKGTKTVTRTYLPCS